MSETFEVYPLLMTPYFSQRPWGGQRLGGVLGKGVPAQGGPYGESWELSDHPDGISTIANGPYAGQTFGELVRRFPREMCGVDSAPERFPLLVKYIDAGDDLSVQVHPSDATAPAGDRGKTECWYIMDCEPGAQLIYNLAPGVTAASLREAASSGQMEACVQRIVIRPGDFVYIPAGTVHAILAGTLLCEVQQSSNTTYRLWDWNRQPPRTLHVEEACAVSLYEPDPAAAEPVNVRDLPAGQWRQLVINEFFEVQAAHWQAGQGGNVNLPNPHGLIVNVVAGGGTLKLAGTAYSLALGQTLFIPAGQESLSVQAGPNGLELLASRSLEL